MDTRPSVRTVRPKRYLRNQPVQTVEDDHVQINQQEVRYAGFWMRFWAFIFDLLIISSINAALVGTWLPFVQVDGTFTTFLATMVLVPSLLYACLFFIYFSLMTKFFGQTLGKMIFGLKVVPKDGDHLTWGTIFFREGVGRFLHQAPLFGNFFLILYIVVACTPKKQGIHDLFADTYVIHC